MADAPDHLGASKKLYREVTDEYPDMAPEESEVLRLACEALDRANSARKAVRRKGAVYLSKPHNTPKPNPQLAIARAESTLAAKLLKQLGLSERDNQPERKPGKVNRKPSKGRPRDNSGYTPVNKRSNAPAGA